ncbi:MAG: hypothetical protein OXT67_11720, partial [Zetaproteobacteria bacterium]|nr:hypothetical protein [Zetaproteobacteria bacterium]
MKISIFNLVRLCTSWLAVCTITQPGWAGYIHPTAKVHPTATIHHPEGVFIGADAEIGPNVSIYSKELYLGQYSKLENIELVEDQVWIEGFLTIKGSDNQPSLKTLYGRSKSPKIVVMLRSNRDGKHNILDEIDLDNKDKRADVFPAQNGTQVLITPHSRAKIHYDLAKFEQEKQALDTRWRQNIYKIAILSEEKKRHFSKSKYRIQIASLEAERVSINYKLDINKD